jgi:predicted nucleotidyltransferase
VTPTPPNLPLEALRAAARPDVDAVRLVVLFGSRARGVARQDSDVDVGVLGGTTWEQLRVGGRVADVLRAEPHVVDLGTAADAVRFQIAREGVVLHAAPEAWQTFVVEAAMRWYDLAPMIEACAAGVRERLRREGTPA